MHRPRHGGRQLVALICALLFFLTPTTMWVIGMRPAEIDNRKLAGFPRPDEGWGMVTGLPEWASDQLIFRGSAVTAADRISRNVFREPPPFDSPNGSGAGPLPEGPAPPHDAEPDEPQDRQGSPRVIEGADGWLYLGKDISGKCSPERDPETTVRLLQRLRSAVESSGRSFVLVIAPDKTTMVPQYLPDDYVGKECAAEVTQQLWPQLINDAGAVDLRPGLQEAGEQLGRPAYSPNDTHWTDEGSVLMTRQIVEQLSPGTSAMWRVTPAGTYTSSADLATMLGKSQTKTNTRYQIRPNGLTENTDRIAKDTDDPVRRTGPAINGVVGGSTLMFGDSFTNAASGYLAAGFTDLTMYSYSAAGGDSDKTIDLMVDSDTVVLQMVERAVASGSTGMVNADFIQRLEPRLAANPR